MEPAPAPHMGGAEAVVDFPAWRPRRPARHLLPAFSALVLDGQECHALTAVRSLGRHAIRDAIAADKPNAMAFRSRY
ncbi:MAG: hypothetical protein AAB387_03765, partial [candidate division NC10 bacterium]